MRPPFLSVPDFAFQFSLSPPPLLPPESLSLVFFSCWPMSLSFIFVSFLGRCPPSSFGSRGYNQKSAARLSIQVIDSLISRQLPDEYCARAVSISLDTLVCTSFKLFRDSKLLQRRKCNRCRRLCVTRYKICIMSSLIGCRWPQPLPRQHKKTKSKMRRKVQRRGSTDSIRFINSSKWRPQKMGKGRTDDVVDPPLNRWR